MAFFSMGVCPDLKNSVCTNRLGLYDYMEGRLKRPHPLITCLFGRHAVTGKAHVQLLVSVEMGIHTNDGDG
jgi:hypothetical protein